jgi:nucleoside-diphosphate-sugar epimerase
MIVSITGGTGFIGRPLVERHLEAGDTVRVLTRRAPSQVSLGKSVEYIHADLVKCEASLLDQFMDRVTVFYNCAGEIRDPRRMPAVHVEGTRRLIRAAEGKLQRWVQLSSVGVYGPQRNGVVTEESPMRPCGVYEKTKTMSDELVLGAAAAGAFTTAVLRPSNVFGPMMTNRSLFQLIGLIDKSLFFFIGKPGASANYIYVDNVVEGLIRCGISPEATGGIFNLSDWRPLESFVATIARLLGKGTPTTRLPETPVRWVARLLGRIPGVPLKESRVDALAGRASYTTNRIECKLGYAHPVTMETGLDRLVSAWRAQR